VAFHVSNSRHSDELAQAPATEPDGAGDSDTGVNVEGDDDDEGQEEDGGAGVVE